MANYITTLRILLIFPILIMASPEAGPGNWIALVLFVIAGITDHLDGYDENSLFKQFRCLVGLSYR